MRLIKELRDLEVQGKDFPRSKEDYRVRIAARAIVIDESRDVAVMHTPRSKHSHYKIPGGGLEKIEMILDALKREIKEEVGCDIEILKEVGQIIEYKNIYNQKQTSYCFLAKVKGGKGIPHFTDEELKAGYEIQWMPIKKAIKLFQETPSNDYTGRFIRLRDLCFLSEAEKLMD